MGTKQVVYKTRYAVVKLSKLGKFLAIAFMICIYWGVEGDFPTSQTTKQTLCMGKTSNIIFIMHVLHLQSPESKIKSKN